MCYNYDVSITTFTLGTLATLYNVVAFGKNPLYMSINFFWMGAILMQLWEALLWKNYNCTLFSKLAKYTNLVQPLLGLVLLLIPNYIEKNKINVPFVFLVIAFYILTILPILLKDYKCIKNSSGIALKWWDYMSAWVYALTILVLMKTLLPNKLFKYQAMFFIGGLLVAHLITIIFNINTINMKELFVSKNPGRIGSIWCWVAAAAPFYNYYLFKNKF